MKKYGGVEVAVRIHNLGSRWSCVVSFTPRRERAPRVHRRGRSVGLRAGLDAGRNNPSLFRESNSRYPAHSQLLYWM